MDRKLHQTECRSEDEAPYVLTGINNDVLTAEAISLLQFRGRGAGSQLPNLAPRLTDRNFLSTFALKNAILVDDRTPHASRKIGAPRGASLLTMAYRPGVRISQSSLPAADQIKSLIQRGMAVPDDGLAPRCLTHIGYRQFPKRNPLTSMSSTTSRAMTILPCRRIPVMG